MVLVSKLVALSRRLVGWYRTSVWLKKVGLVVAIIGFVASILGIWQFFSPLDKGEIPYLGVRLDNVGESSFSFAKDAASLQYEDRVREDLSGLDEEVIEANRRNREEFYARSPEDLKKEREDLEKSSREFEQYIKQYEEESRGPDLVFDQSVLTEEDYWNRSPEEKKEEAYQTSITEGGVRVVAVFPGGPADRSGIKVEDVISEVSSTRVKNVVDFSRVFDDYEAGDSVRLKVNRVVHDSEFDDYLPVTVTVRVTLEE